MHNRCHNCNSSLPFCDELCICQKLAKHSYWDSNPSINLFDQFISFMDFNNITPTQTQTYQFYQTHMSVWFSVTFHKLPLLNMIYFLINFRKNVDKNNLMKFKKEPVAISCYTKFHQSDQCFCWKKTQQPVYNKIEL